MRNLRPDIILSLIILIITSSVFSQSVNENLVKNISVEGEQLYKLELLTWESSSYIYEHADMSILRGFVAYYEGGAYHCIYWNGAYDNLEVIHTFSVLNPEAIEHMQVDNTPRKLSPHEQILYDTKMQAMLEIRGNPEYFTAPPDALLSVQFIEDKNQLKAYVFPSISGKGIIPLGSDYKMIFNTKSQLLSKSKIHSKYITISTHGEPDEEGKLKTFQSTKGGSPNYISPTTICNLLLYSNHPEIHEHHVISDRYLSFYLLGTKSLFITPH